MIVPKWVDLINCGNASRKSVLLLERSWSPKMVETNRKMGRQVDTGRSGVVLCEILEREWPVKVKRNPEQNPKLFESQVECVQLQPWTRREGRKDSSSASLKKSHSARSQCCTGFLSKLSVSLLHSPLKAMLVGYRWPIDQDRLWVGSTGLRGYWASLPLKTPRIGEVNLLQTYSPCYPQKVTKSCVFKR